MKNKVLFLLAYALIFTCFMSCNKEYLEGNPIDYQAGLGPVLQDCTIITAPEKQCVISLHPAPIPQVEKGAQLMLTEALSKNVVAKFHLRSMGKYGQINHNYRIFKDVVIPAGSRYVDVDLGPYWGGIHEGLGMWNPSEPWKPKDGTLPPGINSGGDALLLEISGIDKYGLDDAPASPKIYYNASVLKIKFSAPAAGGMPEYSWYSYSSTNNIHAGIN